MKLGDIAAALVGYQGNRGLLVAGRRRVQATLQQIYHHAGDMGKGKITRFVERRPVQVQQFSVSLQPAVGVFCVDDEKAGVESPGTPRRRDCPGDIVKDMKRWRDAL